MSTLNTYNLKSPDSANTNLALDASGNVAIQAGSASAPSIYVTGDTNTGLYSPGADQVAVTTGGTARLFVDASGRLLVGTSTTRSWSGVDSQIQIESTSLTSQSIFNNSASTTGALFAFGKSRGTSTGSNTVVQSGDTLGNIVFLGADGSALKEGASVKVEVDGTPGSNDMPGRLVFSTTADGASSPTERLRIDKDGAVMAAAGTATVVTNDNHHQFVTSFNNYGFRIRTTNTGQTADAFRVENIVSAGSGWNIFRGYSGNGSSSATNDVEFALRGDGNGYCDGSWTGGGADYAEYFEWSDSNPNEEDRRGISVVLDGDKIREAVAGEDPIGVISGNPSVVGDAAWNKWSGKYLRDEFGTYIQEDYEIEDEDGNTVVKQRRKLNPAYDPDVEYVSREQRPEWDCVGLMGKLRIRKGQITGSRWIKMRDISDTVEEWLVR